MRPALRPLAFVLAAAFPALAGDTQSVSTYRIDPVHSEIGFKVRHFLSKAPGRFAKFQGTIQVDEKDPSKSSVEVTIDAASISTDNEGRDKHLRSADFFDVEKFPAIIFKSVAVKEVAKGKLEVTGDFTMKGVTRRITVPITNAGTQPGPRPGSVVAGFIDGALKLNRKDFGIVWNRALDNGGTMLSDEVEISLNIAAQKVMPQAPAAPAAAPAK